MYTDKRNVPDHAWTGGSDVGLAVLLCADEAQVAYGAAATEGWYVFATFEGGALEDTTEGEIERNELGHHTGRVVITEAGWRIENTVKETDDATVTLIDEVLTVSPHRYRYALPFGTDEAGNALHQVYGLYHGIAVKGWGQRTRAGELRTRPIEIRGTARPAPSGGYTRPYERATVRLDDQAAWPARLADFLDTASCEIGNSAPYWEPTEETAITTTLDARPA